MRSKTEELKKAIEVMREELYYVIQEKRAGEVAWRARLNLDPIKGKAHAYVVRDSLANQYPNRKFRVIQKDQADAYTSGLKAGLAEHEGVQHRSPLMYMPDNL